MFLNLKKEIKRTQSRKTKKAIKKVQSNFMHFNLFKYFEKKQKLNLNLNLMKFLLISEKATFFSLEK